MILQIFSFYNETGVEIGWGYIVKLFPCFQILL
ncbi:hypothetical protein BANRA_03085 [Acinetobacter baumannii]|nr:hypothetical protein BANRA_03432 [Acinetobacter baumannii]VCX48306.1 hypothetical protein BANRA_03085 [Acinetobacter baumannii]